MILRNVYFREIILKDDSIDEFKHKLGEALNILNHATEDSYNQMTTDGFLDWATDLGWIDEKNIVIKVSGIVSELIEELMNDIVDFWSNDAEKVIKNGKNRNFEFIIVEK